MKYIETIFEIPEIKKILSEKGNVTRSGRKIKKYGSKQVQRDNRCC